MSKNVNNVSTAVFALGAVGTAYIAYQVYKKKIQTKLPEIWTPIGTLKDLYIYPIKSCGPVILNTAECSVLGLRDGWLRDRVLMVTDNKDNFITARAYPDLLLVQPTFQNSILILKHDAMHPISINLAEVALQKSKTATVWGDTVPVYDCGQEASDWFSHLLGKEPGELRLVYYAAQTNRQLRNTSTVKYFKFGKNDTGALPDEVPYNLINEASVDDLNTRLTDCKVTPRAFRPNFVLKGGKPYDEDNWKFVKIGENVFEIIKPCTRCVMTTIDPETGVRHPKTEPLETLKTYRQIENPEIRRAAGNAPRMGVQMALRSGPGGTVSLNDSIYAA